jgi:hypothetical protein
MSTSADQVGGRKLPVAVENAAAPLTGQGSWLGNDVQGRGSPAEAAPALPRPTGVTGQSSGPLTPDIVYLGEQMLYVKDIQSIESPDPLENVEFFR